MSLHSLTLSSHNLTLHYFLRPQPQQPSGPLFLIRELDSKCIRTLGHVPDCKSNKDPEQALRSQVTQSINKLKMTIIQATIPERQAAKEKELFGKRAPKGGLLTAKQTLLLLEHYDLMHFATELYHQLINDNSLLHTTDTQFNELKEWFITIGQRVVEKFIPRHGPSDPVRQFIIKKKSSVNTSPARLKRVSKMSRKRKRHSSETEDEDNPTTTSQDDDNQSDSDSTLSHHASSHHNSSSTQHQSQPVISPLQVQPSSLTHSLHTRSTTSMLLSSQPSLLGMSTFGSSNNLQVLPQMHKSESNLSLASYNEAVNQTSMTPANLLTSQASVTDFTSLPFNSSFISLQHIDSNTNLKLLEVVGNGMNSSLGLTRNAHLSFSSNSLSQWETIEKDEAEERTPNRQQPSSQHNNNNLTVSSSFPTSFSALSVQSLIKKSPSTEGLSLLKEAASTRSLATSPVHTHRHSYSLQSTISNQNVNSTALSPFIQVNGASAELQSQHLQQSDQFLQQNPLYFNTASLHSNNNASYSNVHTATALFTQNANVDSQTATSSQLHQNSMLSSLAAPLQPSYNTLIQSQHFNTQSSSQSSQYSTVQAPRRISASLPSVVHSQLASATSLDDLSHIATSLQSNNNHISSATNPLLSPLPVNNNNTIPSSHLSSRASSIVLSAAQQRMIPDPSTMPTVTMHSILNPSLLHAVQQSTRRQSGNLSINSHSSASNYTPSYVKRESCLPTQQSFNSSLHSLSATYTLQPTLNSSNDITPTPTILAQLATSIHNSPFQAHSTSNNSNT